MRIHYLSIGIIFFLTGCLGNPPTIVDVEVLDADSRHTLDSARVILYRYYDPEHPVAVDSFFTGPEGKAGFRFKPQEGYKYFVEATRRFYQPVLNENGATYDNRLTVATEDTNTSELLLAEILPPDPERFERMHPKIPVSQLIGALAADEWEWIFLPKLQWEDIPSLIQASTDSSYVQQYPRHPLSTYRPDSVRAGLVSLWLVEAIRNDVAKGDSVLGNLMPPSRAPVLGTKYGNPKGLNSMEQMKTARQAYQDWWDAGAGQEKRESAKINPLMGKGLSWM